jgi:hypothetical protein
MQIWQCFLNKYIIANSLKYPPRALFILYNQELLLSPFIKISSFDRGYKEHQEHE